MTGTGPPSSSAAESGPPRSAADAWGQPLELAETERTFYATFRLIARLVHATPDWEQAEFSDLAYEWVGLGLRFPILEQTLRVIIRALAPLAALEHLWAKVHKLASTAHLSRPRWLRPKPVPPAAPAEEGPDAPGPLG